MAAEALAADLTAEGHVEEVKLTNEIKDVTEESCPEPKDIDGKDEEKIEVDYSAAEEVSASKSKSTFVSEEKLEDGKSEPQAEGVKIDCSVTENPEGKYEKTLKVEDSEVGDACKEKQEDEKSEFVDEVRAEEVKDETPKQEADFSTAGSKEEAVCSAAVEPTVEAVIPEPANQSIEVSTADLESTLVQESEYETFKEPAILEEAVEEANTTEELPNVPSELVTEPLIACELVTEPSESVTEVKGTESSEPVTGVRATEPSIASKDLSKQEESSGNVSETPTKELKDEGEGVVVVEEVPNVPELEKVDPCVSIGINSVTESVESLVKLEDKVEEEMQEKSVVAEVPTVTSTAKSDVEDKKDEILEGKNTTLVETFRDIDVQEGKNNVNTGADNYGSKDAEKDDEKTPIEPAKDISDGPKVEVRSKSSHRQSNSMFSKVKQSIVKVKKAIIGKSPSSKTISSEAKDEVKVK